MNSSLSLPCHTFAASILSSLVHHLHISDDFTVSSISLKKVLSIAQICPKSHRTLKMITLLLSDDSQRTIIPRLRSSAAIEVFQAFSWNAAINYQSLIDLKWLLVWLLRGLDVHSLSLLIWIQRTFFSKRNTNIFFECCYFANMVTHDFTSSLFYS